MLNNKGVKIMTYKQINSMREIRLWTGEVVIPLVAVVATVCSKPEAREAIRNGIEDLKEKFKPKKKYRTVKYEPVD